MSEGRQRTYRFGDLRRAGLFGSLPLSFVAPLVVAVGFGWLAVAGAIPVPLVVPVIAPAGFVAFGRVRGRPLHAVLPALCRFGWRRVRGRNQLVPSGAAVDQ